MLRKFFAALIALAMALGLSVAVTPAANAGICSSVTSCLNDPGPGANQYVWLDNSSGQNVGIGIRTSNPPTLYDVVVPANKYFGRTNGLSNSIKAAYVGSGFCVRWIQYYRTSPRFTDQAGSGYAAGPVSLNLTGGWDFALDAYPC